MRFPVFRSLDSIGKVLVVAYGRALPIISVLIIIMGINIVLTPIMPTPDNLPKRDSGVFLYAGQQILAGKLPYVDVWDHKAPLIYYINALGLWLANGDRAGVWLVEGISLFVATWLSVLLFRLSFGPIISLIATGFWLMTLPLVIDGGNLTEEYALAFQFMMLLCFYLGVKNYRPQVMFVFTGIVGGLAILLRPNIIGVWLAILIYLIALVFIRHSPKHVARPILIALGTAISIFIAGGYFAAHNALGEMIDAAITYNLVYSNSTWAQRAYVASQGFEIALSSGILLPSVLFISLTVPSDRGQLHFQHFTAAQRSLVMVALIALPLEIALYIMSGRPYGHYFISLLPVLAILTAASFHLAIAEKALTRAVRFPAKKAAVEKAIVLTLVIAMLILVRRTVLNAMHLFVPAEKLGAASVNDRLEANDLPLDTDYLLMWGAEATQNFLLGIPSPTRYVYQLPLYNCSYATEQMAEEFLRDIHDKKPTIIDTSSSNSEVPPIEPAERATWENEQVQNPLLGRNRACTAIIFRSLFVYLDVNYRDVGSIGQGGWKVYVYADE